MIDRASSRPVRQRRTADPFQDDASRTIKVGFMLTMGVNGEQGMGEIGVPREAATTEIAVLHATGHRLELLAFGKDRLLAELAARLSA